MNDKEKLSNACFRVSLKLVQGYFEEYIDKEQLLTLLRMCTTSIGRDIAQEITEKWKVKNDN